VASETQLPKPIEEIIAAAHPGAEVRLAARSDLATDGRFGERWFVLAGDRVLVWAPDGAAGELAVDLPLSEISEVEIENLVGGSALRAVIKGQRVDLVSFSNAAADRFGRVRMQLDAVVKGKEIPTPEERINRCPSCGLVLGEDTRVCPRCMRKGATFRRLLGYAGPYRWRLILVGVLMLTGTAFGLVPPYLTKLLLDNVLVPKHNPHLLGPYVGALALSSLLATALGIWRGRITAWLGGRVSFDIRAELYDRLQWLSMRYYDRHPTGALISRLTQDSGGVQDFVAFGVPWVTTSLVTVIGVTVVILVMNWKLALLALVPAPLVSIVARALWHRMHMVFHSFWYRWSRFHSLVNDALNRVKMIKAFSQQPVEIERYQVRNRDLLNASVYAEATWATIFPIMGFVMGCGSLLVWYFGGRMRLHDELTVGVLMAFFGYLGMIYGPLNFLTNAAQWMSRALTAAERIFEVLDAESDTEKASGHIVPAQIKGEIEFKDVTFGYERHRPVLHNISFTAQPGHMLGLVGKSGAGKSTVINLICRFYDVDEGEVLVDGIKLRDLSLWAYRGRLGAVLQEPFLFAGTISENIAYGKPTATPEEIIAAAKMANAHDFIVEKADGYDEQVGERGGRLSAGEKQRVCIARAILHDPAILILDEATANVDLETEEQIQQAIARLVEGRTTFAIAHRLSTLRNADRLLVIEEGKMVEFGTHEELDANKKVYHDLLELHRKTSTVTAVSG
jgi:ATP-binding cassette subfamily B protein